MRRHELQSGLFPRRTRRYSAEPSWRSVISSLQRGMLILPAMVAMSGCCDPKNVAIVPNTMRSQETNNWCWAATTQMLAEHFGLSVTQCDLANHRFAKTNCCDEQNPGTSCPKTSDCNTAGWLELDFAGLEFSESSSALSWEEVRDEIFCREKPMGYAYGTPGVVGHVVVINGYISLGDTDYVILNDPWSPCVGKARLLSYDEYADPSGTATHWATWNGLDKK